MKNLLLVAAVMSSIVLFSCGGSCSLEDFAAEGNTILTLGEDYLADSTKCDAYAAGLQSVIDDYSDCDDADITAQVSNYQTFLDALPCK